jgi:hypothetical protein
MLLTKPTFPEEQTIDDLVIETVDMALRGSEYAVEAWKLIKKITRDRRYLTGEELDKLDELIDRARDDLEGLGLRIDFTKGGVGRVYDVGR